MANKDDIQLKINAAVESAEAAKSLGQLRRSLMEIQTLQAEIGDTSGAQFDKLSQASANASAKLAETRDRIGDIADKNRTLEGTQIERLTGSFGLLKESIMNLDFDKAKIGAEGLLNTFTPVVDGKLVTGLAGVKGAFGNLAEGVKSLGSTFMSVGKALLTNPIFLLAAAIIAIVAVVVLIMDKLGILKKIMDALGYAIGLVVKAFEALTDWLGLTTNAQEANAAAAKKNGEEQRKQIDATATAQKNLAKLTEGLTQQEVDALKKKAGIKDALNQSSFDIEKTRLIQTQATLANEINALEELKDAGGELTEEQLKDLDQRKTDYDNNAEAIKTIEYQKIAYIEGLNKNLTAQLESWKIKNMANDVERAKAQAQLDKDAELRKLDAIMREAQMLGDTSAYKKASLIKIEVEKAFRNELNKIDKEEDKKQTEAANTRSKNAKAKEEEKAKNKLADLEKQTQLELKLQQEGSLAKVLAENAADQKIFEEKKKSLKKKIDIDLLEKELDERKFKRLQDYDKLVAESNEKILISNLQLAVLTAKTEEERYEARKTQIEELALLETNKKYQEISSLGLPPPVVVEDPNSDAVFKGFDLNAAKALNYVETPEMKAKKQEVKQKEIETQAELDALDAEYNAKKYQRAVEASENKLSSLQYDYDNERTFTLKTTENGVVEEEKRLLSKAERKVKLDELMAAEKQALTDSMALELVDLDLTEQQKADIKEKYRQLDLDRHAKAKEREMELNQRAWKNGVELAQKGNQMAQSLSDALFAFKARDGARTLAQQKKDAENQFKVNRALQVSTAIITGIQSVMAAFANGMKNPIPLLGPATAGVYAAIAGITAAANVAKILATKFDASSFTPPTTDGGGGGGGTPPAEQAPTNFQPNQFFGLGQQTAVGMPGGPKPIKVYVTEGDIRDVSERVSVIEKRAVY
jgi:hypothetical protein